MAQITLMPRCMVVDERSLGSHADKHEITCVSLSASVVKMPSGTILSLAGVSTATGKLVQASIALDDNDAREIAREIANAQPNAAKGD